MASNVNRLNYRSGGQGIRQCACNSLQNKDLEQSPETGVIKSVIVADSPEDEQLSDVVSAWTSLPSNVRAAIILLVQSYVQ